MTPIEVPAAAPVDLPVPSEQPGPAGLPPSYPVYMQPGQVGANGQVPEATYQAQQDPRFYQGPRSEYYSLPPPGYYPYAPPVAAPAREEGAPWFLWVGLGMAAMFIINKVIEFQKNPKTPQQMMTEMMMKQAMNAMGGKPGASPFGGAAGMPPFPGAAAGSPFGGMPPGFGSASGPTGTSAPVDIPASSVTDSRKGEKFSSRFTNEGRSTTDAAKADASRSSNLDVVEPLVKEPAGASNGSNSSPKPGFFTDVNESKGAAAGASSTYGQGQQQKQQPTPEATDSMMSMMETMLRNPEMQKMLYPYLPENMRNPSSIEWMLSNPEVKKQMAQMFEQQNMMSPQMMDMMKGMDFNQEKVNQQFDDLGLKPEDVISKVMSDPELASGFQNPKVQAAIMDISQNPMNIMKYQTDPEIMKVLEKVTQVFQPGAKQ